MFDVIVLFSYARGRSYENVTTQAKQKTILLWKNLNKNVKGVFVQLDQRPERGFTNSIDASRQSKLPNL